MKLGHSHDFYCRVSTYDMEIMSKTKKPLFSDVYLLVLQTIVSIAFVPFIDRDNIELPPNLPDFEKFTSNKEAHLYVVDTTDYIVTPDGTRTGTIETMIQNYDKFSRIHKIFYISSDEYNCYIKNLSQIENMVRSNFAGIKVSELGTLDLINFLRKKIIVNMAGQIVNIFALK